VWGTPNYQVPICRFPVESGLLEDDLITTAFLPYRLRNIPGQALFKALKQNLKIKTFVGTSANALKIQIWTALIALLLVRYLQLRSRVQWHLSRFLALLRHQLFVYRDLWRFLDDPFEGPPPLRKDYVAPQPSLFTMIEEGPPGTSHQPTVGQPQLQNTEIASASPLLSNQPQLVPG
jgi:hypothetical protein